MSHPISNALLKWRKQQKRGAIMKPSTFADIVKKEMKAGLSKESATKVAGKAYWRTAKSKFNS
jgi:hypothetical protein